MNVLAIALAFSALEGSRPMETYQTHSITTAEIDANILPLMSDSIKRFSKAGYSLVDHVIQIRSEGPLTYISYIYKSGPSRGGSGPRPCCVSITYEYEAGKFIKSYFAR
jgi:hypothetical protein